MVGPSRGELGGDESVDQLDIARKSRKMRAATRRLLMEARLVEIESKRIRLWNAERRFRHTRLDKDKSLVRTLQAELEHAEAVYNAESAIGRKLNRPARLRKLYANLIATGTAAVEQLSAAVPHLPPASQFDTAVRVQALEELIGQWRATDTTPSD